MEQQKEIIIDFSTIHDKSSFSSALLELFQAIHSKNLDLLDLKGIMDAIILTVSPEKNYFIECLEQVKIDSEKELISHLAAKIQLLANISIHYLGTIPDSVYNILKTSPTIAQSDEPPPMDDSSPPKITIFETEKPPTTIH